MKSEHTKIKIVAYEVSSIKNANLSIKYEGIKLPKMLIACKKGVNVVVRYQYSEIGWLENSAFHRQLKTQKKWTPSYISKKVLNFSNKWLRTTNLQLSQKSFKTSLRKLTIIASFIHRNNLLFYFFLNKKIEKKEEKNRTNFFF